MLFALAAPVVGLFCRWNIKALMLALAIGIVGDVVLLGPPAVGSMPFFEGPVGLAGFLLASTVSSIIASTRRPRSTKKM